MPRGYFKELMVQTSDSWKKRAPWKISEISFWLETTKNDHSREGWGCALVLKLVCPSQKCPFIPRIALSFPGIVLLFSKSALNAELHWMLNHFSKLFSYEKFMNSKNKKTKLTSIPSRRFSGFISRCITFFEWQYSKAVASCDIY